MLTGCNPHPVTPDVLYSDSLSEIIGALVFHDV